MGRGVLSTYSQSRVHILHLSCSPQLASSNPAANIAFGLAIMSAVAADRVDVQAFRDTGVRRLGRVQYRPTNGGYLGRREACLKRLFLTAFALASCANAQSTPTLIGVENRDALQAYQTCLYTRARERDNGATDTTHLARAVAQDCRAALGAVADAVSRDQSQTSHDAFYQEWLSKEILQATAAIAAQRQDRRVAIAVASLQPNNTPQAPKLSGKGGPRSFATAKGSAQATPMWQGKPMSAWRRAYIARHGHQPPLPRR